jgi:DnaD/phage-associated family protein
VPNIFIAEYVADVPGDYVKVYLYAWMHTWVDRVVSNELIARDLDMDVEQVLAAWTWFAEKKIIRKVYPDVADQLRYDVEFVDLKSLVFENGNHKDAGADDEDRENDGVPAVPGRRFAFDDARVRSLLLEIEKIFGKTLSGNVPMRVNALLDDGANPDLVSFAFRYCAEKRSRPNINYVSEVVRGWLDAGVSTPEEAREHLAFADARYDLYKQIMRALGLRPTSITEAEKKIFDEWIDDMGFTMEEIFAAAEKSAGKSNKFDYARKILENEYEKASGRRKGGSGGLPGFEERTRYYEGRRADSESAAETRRRTFYDKCPGAAQLDEDLVRLNMESVRALMSGASNRENAARRIAEEIDKKVAERRAMLEAEGLPEDYTELKYHCEKCHDTGVMDDGGACDCFVKNISTS